MMSMQHMKDAGQGVELHLREVVPLDLGAGQSLQANVVAVREVVATCRQRHDE
jgi:hypothetical protein